MNNIHNNSSKPRTKRAGGTSITGGGGPSSSTRRVTKKDRNVAVATITTNANDEEDSADDSRANPAIEAKLTTNRGDQIRKENHSKSGATNRKVDDNLKNLKKYAFNANKGGEKDNQVATSSSRKAHGTGKGTNSSVIANSRSG